MIVPWLITTAVIGILSFLVDYLSNPSNPIGASIVSGFLSVTIINLLFWLPAVAHLHKKRKISLRSSVASSLAAACIGSATTIGLVFLLLAVNEGQFPQFQTTGGYTAWIIGHIHYWTLSVRIILLWGINGILFWKLYGEYP